MAKATMKKSAEFDLRHTVVFWNERHAEGKALRTKVPRESLADWKAPKNRHDPVKTVLASNKAGCHSLFLFARGAWLHRPSLFCGEQHL